MKQRILFWGSIVLAVGGIVCSAFCLNAEGETNIALWIASLVLILLGIVGITLSRNSDRKEQFAAHEQEEKEERAFYEGAKFLSVFYGGSKKRIAAPTQKDTFLIELYLTEDGEAVRQYFAGKMPKDRADAFYHEHARLLSTVLPTLQELEQLSGRVIFVERAEYTAMRESEAYRKLFSENEIVPV